MRFLIATIICLSASSLFANNSYSNYLYGISVLPRAYLQGNYGIEKDEKRAFELFKDIEFDQIAKIYLAYCYYSGVGTKVDKQKAQEYLDSIEKPLSDEMHYLTGSMRDWKFIEELKKASNKVDDKIKVVLRDFQASKEDMEKYSKLAEENPEKYYKDLHFFYSRTNNDEKILSVLKYFKQGDNQYRFFSDVIVKKNKPEFAKKFFNDIENSKTKFPLEYAYCLYYGYGMPADKSKALEIMNEESKIKLKYSHLVSFPKTEYVDLCNFVYHYALMAKENGNEEPYLKCLRDGIGVERNLEKLIKIRYDKIKGTQTKYTSELTLIMYNLSALNKEPELYNKDLMEIEFDVLSRQFKLSSSGRFLEYFCYLLYGYANEVDEKAAFELINKIYNRAKTEGYNPSVYCLEALAFCYDNGIGTAKDIDKAKALRAEVLDISMKKPSYFEGLASYYRPSKKFHIQDENMFKYYDNLAREHYEFYQFK